MNFPIDVYELRARYAPAFIISSPFFITLWTCAPSEFQNLSAFAGSIISMIFWYCLAMFVRYCGKNAEIELWNDWKGNPAANLLLWENEIIHDDLKQQYHTLIETYLSLPMFTREEEKLDKLTAIKRSRQAFYRVRGLLRKFDPTGLWFTDLAEYGFSRNLYGSKVAWRIISSLMVCTSGLFLFSEWNNLIFLGIMINSGMFFFSFYFGGKVMKRMAKEIAYQYGQHSWESFQNIAYSDVIRNDEE